jgi:hypothetical protein
LARCRVRLFIVFKLTKDERASAPFKTSFLKYVVPYCLFLFSARWRVRLFIVFKVTRDERASALSKGCFCAVSFNTVYFLILFLWCLL